MTKKQADRYHRLLPHGVPRWVRIYDNGGETADRYVCIFTGRYFKGKHREFQEVFMSASPFHPQGVGIHSSTSYRALDTFGEKKNHYYWPPALGRKCHLGTRIHFTDLPEDCQKLVLQDYKEIWNLA